MKALFRSLIISVVSILVTVGVANAVGVFYYDSVNDAFVLDGDMAVSGGGRLDGYFKEINSAPTKDFYINSQRDLNIQLGAAKGSKFGVNNSANSRIFQVDDAGVLKLGKNLDSGAQGQPVTVNFSADGNGNVEIKGASNLAGGVNPTGKIYDSWSESLKLVSPKNGLITLPSANLGFGFADSIKGFYWVDTSSGSDKLATNIMILSSAGALSVLGEVRSNNFTLGGTNKSSWLSIYSGGTYVKAPDVITVMRAHSKAVFGGMFAMNEGNSVVGANGECPSTSQGLVSIPNQLITGGSYCKCPDGFTEALLVSNTVYVPKIYYCYKPN